MLNSDIERRITELEINMNLMIQNQNTIMKQMERYLGLKIQELNPQTQTQSNKQTNNYVY